MEFVQLPAEKARALSGLAKKAKRISERRTVLLNELASACEAYRPLVEAGVSISKPTAEGSGVVVTTPCGNARTSLGWTFDGIDLIGTVVFERERLDQYGKTYWEPIFGLRIPEFECPSSGKSPEAVVIPLDDGYGDDLRGSLFRTAVAIAYGIIQGPSV